MLTEWIADASQHHLSNDDSRLLRILAMRGENEPSLLSNLFSGYIKSADEIILLPIKFDNSHGCTYGGKAQCEQDASIIPHL